MPIAGSRLGGSVARFFAELESIEGARWRRGARSGGRGARRILDADYASRAREVQKADMRAGGEIVYIAVGANLGDREATFAAVIRALKEEGEWLILAASSIYETPPLGPAGQPPYLNAVVALRAWLSPIDLLRRLQAIEDGLGRNRGPDAVRWGPRLIDLDVLFYGDRCIDLPDLVVPHPAAHERAFVMTPLAELAPTLCHPVLGVAVSDIADGLPGRDEVRVWQRPEGWPGAA